MSHVRMSHVTQTNEARHTYEWVMPHNIVMSHIECVMSYIHMSHITHMNESRHIYEWVMVHIWMSHVTYMNESCRKYERVAHMLMSHITRMHEPCLKIWMRHMKQTNGSCHTDNWVHRLWHTYTLVKSHVCMDHTLCHVCMDHTLRYECQMEQMDHTLRYECQIEQTNASRHIDNWVMSHA